MMPTAFANIWRGLSWTKRPFLLLINPTWTVVSDSAKDIANVRFYDCSIPSCASAMLAVSVVTDLSTKIDCRAFP